MHRDSPCRTLARLIDGLLEATVVLSFTDIGPMVRSRLFGWQDLDAMRMDGRVVLITGGSSGLGRATAERLTRMGSAVRLLVRDRAKGERVREAIREATPSADVELYTADLSDLGSIRGATSQILEREPRLDVLVNNAGALLAERRLSVEGFEMTFAAMVLGPFALTQGLGDLLERTAAAHGTTRVINVSSGGMYTQGLHLDDLQMEHGPYRGSVAYARAKRAQVVLTERWARRWRDRGIVVHAMHPGWADTPGIAAGLPRFGTLIGPRLRSPEEGADTIVWLAASPEAIRSTGRFWLDRRPRSVVRLPGTAVTAHDGERLWDACVCLTAEGADARD